MTKQSKESSINHSDKVPLKELQPIKTLHLCRNTLSIIVLHHRHKLYVREAAAQPSSVFALIELQLNIENNVISGLHRVHTEQTAVTYDIIIKAKIKIKAKDNYYKIFQ